MFQLTNSLHVHAGQSSCSIEPARAVWSVKLTIWRHWSCFINMSVSGFFTHLHEVSLLSDMSTFGRSFHLKLLCLSINSRLGLHMCGYVIARTSLQPWTQAATSSCSQGNSSVCTASGIKLCGSWKWQGGRHWPGEDVVQSYPCCGNGCMYGHWLPALQARLPTRASVHAEQYLRGETLA